VCRILDTHTYRWPQLFIYRPYTSRVKVRQQYYYLRLKIKKVYLFPIFILSLVYNRSIIVYPVAPFLYLWSIFWSIMVYNWRKPIIGLSFGLSFSLSFEKVVYPLNNVVYPLNNVVYPAHSRVYLAYVLVYPVFIVVYLSLYL